MKTFGKFFLGLGVFSAGMYAGAFISAFVAEKVMDSPLDESVLRKHNRHKNESKLGYSVFADSDGEKAPAYYTSFDAFLHEDHDSFPLNSKVRIKMKDGAVIDYIKNPDGWVMDATVPDPIHVSAIIYGDINKIKLEYYEFFDNDLILNFPNDDSGNYKIYKYTDGKLTDINADLCYDEDTSDDSDDDAEMIIADYKGPVKTFNDLPKNPEIGDYFLVEDADNGKGCIYIYTKNGYAIPEVTDGVSLNDIFKFKVDAHEDTDSDTVPTYYESLELFLNDDQIVSVPFGTKVCIKMQSGNVVEYRRIPSGWARSSRLSASTDYIAIHYGELTDDTVYDFYEPQNGDYILGVSADAKTYYIYRWYDDFGLYCYDAEDKTSPYLPDSEFASDESNDDESTYYDSLLAFLDDERTVSMPCCTKVRIKMKDGVVLQYGRTSDGWTLDSAMPDPNHISGIFYGDINLVNFGYYNFYEGDLILNIPFAEDVSEKAKLYKWHNGEITDTAIMIDRRDEDDTAAEESNS